MTNQAMAPELAERTVAFRAMGSTAEVVVVAHESLIDQLCWVARTRIDLLERTWSRFLADSELSQLNARAGHGPVVVSIDLLALVTAMVDGWERTEGRFDPTVLEAVRAHGYDSDFASVIARGALQGLPQARPTAGMADIVIDVEASTIDLPAGIGLDPGAIGKGLAADLVVDELLAAGAAGALVSLGGDLAFGGTSPHGIGWTIGVEDERVDHASPQRLITTWTFDAPRGGVATSTTRKRRWANGTRHHSIDPSTGSMSTSDVAQATVVADRAWVAEVNATAALVLDSDQATNWLDAQGLHGLVLTADSIHHTHDAGRTHV